MITGGTRGIGFAMAMGLMRHGCEVLVCGSSTQSVAEARDIPGLRVIRADLTNSNDLLRVISAVQGELSGLDILINNAGIQNEIDFGASTDFSETSQRIAAEINLNLLAPMQLTAGLLPILMNSEQSVIVNVSSGLGYAPSMRAPVYCGTKAGLSAWTIALRDQLMGTSIGVVELVPPLVKTQLTQDRQQGAVSPEVVSDALMKGLRTGRQRIVVGKARLLLSIAAAFPPLARALVRK